MLTPKQEKFCQCIVSGMCGKDAYIAAYDHHGGDRTAYNESNILLKRNDITKRIKELQVPLINHAINTAISEREKIKNKLWQIIDNSDSNDSDRIRAMDILNKMNAEYINIQRVEHDNSMETVDTDKLIEITRLA